MPSRRIYTTSQVIITPPDDSTATVGAVTSATYTRDTPREQVACFGKSGQVDTVRTEGTAATMEIVFHPTTDDNVGTNGFNVGDLNELIKDASKDSPKYADVQVKGVGKLTNAILTSITAEGSVGALPSITLAFDGVGTADATSSAATTASFNIANMQTVKLIAGGNEEGGYAKGNITSFAQSATFNWEMPTERIARIGTSPDSVHVYGMPPGTASIATEGIQDSGRITAVEFGAWTFTMDTDSKVSNVTNNMAVGEIGATYNTTTEGVAEGVKCADGS